MHIPDPCRATKCAHAHTRQKSLVVQRSPLLAELEDDPVSTSESPCPVRTEGSHSLPGAARHATVGEETMALLWNQQVSLLV